MRFAMLSVVERGKSVILRVRQVTPLDTDVGVLRGLLSGLPFKPRLLLLDRGFYSAGVVLALRHAHVHFLMPAPRTPGIKRAIEEFERGARPALGEYTLRGQRGNVRVWLMLARERTKDGWRAFAFISDLPLDPELVRELYSSRWRIETANRELKHFLARTTTRNMGIRRTYYWLAVLLYNLWIALRWALGRLTKFEFRREFHRWLRASSETHGQPP
jgi:hypothetical protein